MRNAKFDVDANVVRSLLCCFVIAGGGGLMQTVFAAQTDLSNKPLASTTSAQAKPNIMLLMDTSNSMKFSHMPDEMEGTNTGKMPIGYKSYRCNVLYYNPNVTYALPKDAAGNFLPAPSFAAAPYNYYSTDATTVDLSTSFRAYDASTRQNNAGVLASDDPQPAYYYTYSLPVSVSYASPPCTDVDTDVTKVATTGGTWTRVLVSATSGPGASDERQNFANWYTYYRTRINLIKSAVSLSFTPLTDSYRVGLITVRPDLTGTANYLPIDDFGSTQRTNWFSKLFSQTPGGSSPAREALARVGRHYAGRQDGINDGMTGDPVQYSCQQNFAIMTTDGYWNVAAETAGPVRIDGTTLVGQQDGTLDGLDHNTSPGTVNVTPRPIWDGGADLSRVVTDVLKQYQAVPCTSLYANVTTAQVNRSTSQVNRSTSQLTQSTSQVNQSTSQVNQSTSQLLRNTSQLRRSTAQITQSTSQLSRSTSQLTRSTSQLQAQTLQHTQSTLQRNRSTSQINRSTSQLQRSTSQLTRSTSQLSESTSQINRSTSQLQRSTSQLTASTAQINRSTSQISRSTSQLTMSTAKVYQSTSQILKYDGATELTTAVASCTPSGTVSCSTVATGPTLVASCTPVSPTAGNFYTTTTCSTTTTGPTGVASCTPAAASSGNGYTTTTCNTVTAGPTLVASCTPATASSGNSYTATTCNTVTTGPTPVSSCTPAAAAAGNSYTATTCNTVTTGPTGVASCTPAAAAAGNSYTATTCNTVTTGPTGVASCTPAAAAAGNSYTATTCNTATTGPTPVASCTPATASSGNSYTATTCNTVTTGPTLVASCTPATASAGNSYTTRTCNNVTTGPTPVASCTAATANAGNSYTATTCNTVTTGPTGVASCAPAAAAAGNSYTATTCNTATTGPTPVASCTPATASSGNSYTATTCNTTTTGPTPVASCSAATANSGNSYTTTTCNNVTTGPTPVASCTPVAAAAGNSYIATTCNDVTTATGVATCTPIAASAGNNWTATTCNTVTTGPTGVATCTPATAAAGNSWTTTTCNTVTTGPTFVASCSPATASSGNSYTATTCNNATTGPTPVASCTPVSAAAGNSYTATTCNTVTTGPTGVASCAPAVAAVGNSWTATTCNTATTGPTGVSSCTPAVAAAGNSYVATTCNTATTGPTPVASCTPASASAGNSYTATTCNTTTTGPTPVASCSAATANAGNSYTATTCNTATTGPTGVASCTAAAAAAAGNSYTATTCNTATTGPTPVASCTPAAAAAGNSHTATTCNTVTTGPTPVASCTPATASAGNSYTTRTCNTVTTPLGEAATCTPIAASAGNSYTTTSCAYLPGQKSQSRLRTSVTSIIMSGANELSRSSTNTDGAWADTTGVCVPDASTLVPPLGSLPLDARASVADATPPASCSDWPCTVDTPLAGGSSNSLADVAQYYYITDLRPSMVNDVPKTGTGPEDDKVDWQHMTTFTIALGVSGSLNYKDDYKASSTTADIAGIRTNPATKSWPVWPDPAVDYLADASRYSDARSIDDFWHTAVNGRGQYFSAGNPDSVINGLKTALAGINARLASASAAATSNLEPVAGDNFAYTAKYTTATWVGELEARSIDLNTGVVSLTPIWSAQTLLDAKTSNSCDNRTIHLFRAGATENLVDFSWNTKSCDAGGLPTGTARTGLNGSEQTNFSAANSVLFFSQYPNMTDGTLSTADQRTPAAGENLVNFVRGQRGFEGFVSNDATKLYRTRSHVLGDIVNAQPVYVKAPFSFYSDPGYDSFRTDKAGREAMVYVGANDGMLHAFNAATGQESWAFIPSAALPNLYKLADDNYANNHVYSVDGSATVGDIYDPGTFTLPTVAGAWKTILVAGMNSGGKSYYALDVTDPAAPKGLWEFKWSNTCYDEAVSTTHGADCHLGYTFGKPVISKLQDGTWVVIVTSGYNNVNTPSKTGDGIGYLYVLNAVTGKIISKISTGVGDATTPSGLGQIINFVDNTIINNTTLRVYGSDLLGNVWRFDVNDNILPGGLEATLIGTAKDSSGTPQPITTRPELAEVSGKPMVFVATGRLLGASDLTDSSIQSVYGIIDPLDPGSATVYTDLRGALKPLTMSQTGTGASAYRTISCTAAAAACGSTSGWVVDLPDTGERVNVDFKLQLGTLVFASNVPQNSACNIGGYSWINFMDYVTGNAVSTDADHAVSRRLSASLAVGLNIVRLPNGKTVVIATTSDATQNTLGLPVVIPPPVGKRISWREIIE